jgi:putative ABC transport system permease protein
MRVALPWRKYGGEDGPAKTRLFYGQLLERVATLPGVESAALTNNLPLSGETENGKSHFTIEGQSPDQQQLNPYLNDLLVSPNYFQAMGVRLMRGRVLNELCGCFSHCGAHSGVAGGAHRSDVSSAAGVVG